jgi:hypothetical protein
MTEKSTTATPAPKDGPPVAVKPAEAEGHIDHVKEAIKDAAEKIVARVEHERSEHEHAAHEGRVHQAREAIQEAVDKVGRKLPGGKR